MIEILPTQDFNSRLIAKFYVDNVVDEVSIVRNNQDNDLNFHNSTNLKNITLNTQAVKDNQLITKAYEYHFHQVNERSRRDLGIDSYDESSDLVKNKQDNDLNDNKSTNLDSIKVKRNPTSDNEFAIKEYVDDLIEDGTILSFNQSLENYLKVTVGNDTYYLSKFDKIQITDVTDIKSPNSGSDLLQKWKIVNNDKKNECKIGKFLKSTETNSQTGDSGATILPPIGDSVLYIETSSNILGNNVFLSWERTDIIQITNLTFYYKRFSILTNDSLKAMGRFHIQLILEDDTQLSRYNIPKNDR